MPGNSTSTWYSVSRNSHSPLPFWLAFKDQKPAGYELPEAYRAATQADYDQLDSEYASHLKGNLLDATKALVDPLFVVPPDDYWTRTA